MSVLGAPQNNNKKKNTAQKSNYLASYISCIHTQQKTKLHIRTTKTLTIHIYIIKSNIIIYAEPVWRLKESLLLPRHVKV